VKKKVTNDNSIKTTDYLDGFQYNQLLLEFFPHSEGYVKATNTGFTPGNPNYAFNYVYNYTDHLGNVRLSYAKDPQTGNLKILDESHYYPFGLKHQEYQANGFTTNPIQGVIIAPVANNPFKYKYNGKELQDELGLNFYDYGARNYDPAIGRWMNYDPLAEQMRRHSPYNYAFDNPIYFIDPDGRSGEDWFVNNKTGEVHYVHNVSDLSTMSQAERFQIGMNGEIADYENIGKDDMLGDHFHVDGLYVNTEKGNYTAVSFGENSESFMKDHGYDKAEKVTIHESVNNLKGSFGPGENITHTDNNIEQIGDSKISYAKTEDMNTKNIIKERNEIYSYSTLKSTDYKLTKPYGQSNSVTAVYYENRKPVTNNTVSNTSTVLRIIVDFFTGTKMK